MILQYRVYWINFIKLVDNNITSIKSIFSFSSKLWELDWWPEAGERGHRGRLHTGEQSGAKHILIINMIVPPDHPHLTMVDIKRVDIIYKISGSWCGDWERSTRRYANTGQQGQAGAESLPTIQEHISEAPTAASFERQQQAGLQPEQSEHSQFSKSGRGKKTNPGVNCKPRSSSGQGGDNTTATAGHVLSVSSLLWPTLSGSFAKKNGIIIPSLSLSCFTITIVPYDPHVSISNPQLSLVFILTSCCILSQLCIDTCRKCEQVFPVTSWLPCPPLLNIPDCTSPNLSWMVGIFSTFDSYELSLIRNNTLNLREAAL